MRKKTLIEKEYSVLITNDGYIMLDMGICNPLARKSEYNKILVAK